MQGIDLTGKGYLQAACDFRLTLTVFRLFFDCFAADLGPSFDTARSTPKHYAGYNLDNWHGMDRYHYNALISKQDWADTYSQPFQASVVGAIFD